VIVQEGEFKPEKYATYIEMVKRVLEEATTIGDKEGDEPKHLAVVEVVSSWQEAEEKAGRHEIDILIFISVSMVKIACGFRQRYRELTVYVLTGLPVDGEPYIVPKGILGLDAIQQMVHKH